jgi:hypothetical protein
MATVERHVKRHSGHAQQTEDRRADKHCAHFRNPP